MSLPLVLLPGMMCDARLFGPQRELTTRVIVPELTSADTVQALAAGVLANAPDRFALGGLSMGGIVAMEVVRQAPDRVAGLALMDTNPLAETPDRQALRAPQVARARAGALAEIMRDEMKPHYLAETPRKPAILDLCMAMALDLGPKVFACQSVALRDRPDQCASLRRVKVPTLVLCGREDQLCPLPRHELMQGLVPGATLSVIDGAGHLPVLEQPEATNRALGAWLDHIQPAP